MDKHVLKPGSQFLIFISLPTQYSRWCHWKFSLPNPSGRSMALRSTQPLPETSSRNISEVLRVAGAWGWQTYDLHVPTILKSWSLSLLETSGPVQPCTGIALPFTNSVFCAVKLRRIFQGWLRIQWRPTRTTRLSGIAHWKNTLPPATSSVDRNDRW
jgi:hypothetical protein